MPTTCLRFARYAAPGGCCHIARNILSGDHLKEPHAHDFPEAFWIVSGGGCERSGDRLRQLTPGDLVFVRPEDRHGFRADPGGLEMINLALAPAVVGELDARYFPAGGGPWAAPPERRRHRLGAAAMRRLTAQAGRVAQAYGRADERRAVDRLLLDLLDCLEEEAAQPAMPAWLRSALASLAADRDRLRPGAAALTGLSGRSREHVARTVRRHLGTTPSALINRLRLDAAAEDLRMGDRPIAAVALDAGFENIGYFYRRFRRSFGCTPRAYRRLHAEPVAGR